MNNTMRLTANQHTRRTIQCGFTITEIMVAMVLGLFLTAGVAQIYLGSKQANRLNNALAAIQENGRFA